MTYLCKKEENGILSRLRCAIFTHLKKSHNHIHKQTTSAFTIYTYTLSFSKFLEAFRASVSFIFFFIQTNIASILQNIPIFPIQNSKIQPPVILQFSFLLKHLITFIFNFIHFICFLILFPKGLIFSFPAVILLQQLFLWFLSCIFMAISCPSFCYPHLLHPSAFLVSVIIHSYYFHFIS